MSQDEDPEPPRRPLLGPVFWLLIAAAVLCIAAGAVVGFDGAKLFPAAHRLAPRR